MPAYATHYTLASELLPELKKLYPQLDEAAVIYGAQGPDFLFFHRILPTMKGKSLLKTGTSLHGSDPAVLFGAMQEYVKNGADPFAVSYALGFLSHYALDAAAHPYVYCMQERYTAKRRVHYWGFVVHNRIEFNIDAAILLRRSGFTDAREFSGSGVLIETDERLNSMGRILSFAIEKTLGQKNSAEEYATGFRDMKKLQKALANPHGFKTPLFALMQLPSYLFLGPVISTMSRRKKPDRYWDYMNDSGSEWFYPADKTRVSSESFTALFEKAKADTLSLAADFLSGGDMKAATGSLSFNTGLPVSD